MANGRSVDSKIVTLEPLSDQTGILTWQPSTDGNFTLQVKVEKITGESIENNNEKKIKTEVKNKIIKTLLIDADLRKPSIHYRLGVNNILGLSNLLTDSKLTPKEVIQSIKINKDWDVITAGTRPPDPTRLLGSERLKEIINEIKSINKYDVILIDAPPVLGLSDSLLLGENIDGMILLIGLDIADRGLPSETIKKIKQSGINLFGILTNSTKEQTLTQSGSYGYGGYGKKYGYGYKYEYSLDYQYQPELYASYADNEDLEGETLIEKKQAQKEQTISPLLKFSEMITKYTKKLSKWLDN